jgi:hypothetical protein|uniref:Transmembrane protein n=1 Tax=Sipha flava TaxID=143950 RepID=A0A2S2PXY8_9HEMI
MLDADSTTAVHYNGRRRPHFLSLNQPTVRGSRYRRVALRTFLQERGERSISTAEDKCRRNDGAVVRQFFTRHVFRTSKRPHFVTRIIQCLLFHSVCAITLRIIIICVFAFVQCTAAHQPLPAHNSRVRVFFLLLSVSCVTCRSTTCYAKYL